MRSAKIPDGWEYWTTEPLSEEAAWDMAVRLKTKREALRPSVFVRVRVVRAGRAWWILRKEEERER